MTEKSIQPGRFALYVALILFCMVKPTSAQTQRPDTLPAKANHSDGYTAVEINRGRETDHRLAGPAPVIPPNKTAVTAIRFLSWQNYTRVMLELSQEAKYEVRRLKEDPAKGVPARLYVDIQGARVAMTSKDAIPVDDGLLSQVRIGQYSEDIVRVVLDMTNLGAHNAFVLPGPYRLVIDIYGQKALAPTAPIVAPAITADPAKSKVAPAPPVQGLRKIVLDPGHGGKDPGAIGNGGIAEKDLVLSIARKLAAKLKKEMNVQVVLTRNDDRFVPLEDRTALANAEDADLFISLHMNASPNSEARGIETYYLDNTSDEAAIRLAARENSTARKNVSDLQFILSDMTQNLKLEDSITLAHRLQGAAVGGMGKVLGEVKDLGVKKALFYVLVGARMPSVLVEMFFISNREEGRAMSQGLYQDAMVDALFDGIQKYDQATTMARTL
ncbi:MAG TPA: N-acetylmuramoyl-L-alanine amidase [Candidatus Saccharimonadales bacterium]|nr:N-acetylmuramoyl-L-alanine amidase [Candidatus Saccharimonadales bacterium]